MDDRMTEWEIEQWQALFDRYLDAHREGENGLIECPPSCENSFHRHVTGGSGHPDLNRTFRVLDDELRAERPASLLVTQPSGSRTSVAPFDDSPGCPRCRPGGRPGLVLCDNCRPGHWEACQHCSPIRWDDDQ